MFSVFFSDRLLHDYFFSFLIKAFANLEKLIGFHQQSFIIYKNGENLKILKEMFRQKADQDERNESKNTNPMNIKTRKEVLFTCQRINNLCFCSYPVPTY